MGDERAMSGSGPERHVVLVRHAKSAWPHGVPDHERPLAGKGRRNAQAAGAWFASEGPRPQLVLCSDATRARHTWEIIAASIKGDPPTVRLVPELYGAGPIDVLDQLHRVPAAVSVVVVVGHQPTLGDTAVLLSGRGSHQRGLDQIRAKFPTNGVAVLRFRGRWEDLTARGAVLETFAVPRAS
jgi:phosphohistidine phosphatase